MAPQTPIHARAESEHKHREDVNWREREEELLEAHVKDDNGQVYTGKILPSCPQRLSGTVATFHFRELQLALTKLPAETDIDVVLCHLHRYHDNMQMLLNRGENATSAVQEAIPEDDQRKLAELKKAFETACKGRFLQHLRTQVQGLSNELNFGPLCMKDEAKFFELGRHIACLSGIPNVHGYNINPQEWNRFVPRFHGRDMDAVTHDLCILYDHFQKQLYLQSTEETPMLFYLIWKSLKHLYELLQKDNYEFPTPYYCIESKFFRNRKVRNAFEWILAQPDFSVPRKIEDLVACYCQLINSEYWQNKPRSGHLHDVGYETSLGGLGDDVVTALTVALQKKQWDLIVVRALQHAALRLNLLNASPVVYRRIRQNGEDWPNLGTVVDGRIVEELLERTEPSPAAIAECMQRTLRGRSGLLASREPTMPPPTPRKSNQTRTKTVDPIPMTSERIHAEVTDDSSVSMEISPLEHQSHQGGAELAVGLNTGNKKGAYANPLERTTKPAIVATPGREVLSGIADRTDMDSHMSSDADEREDADTDILKALTSKRPIPRGRKVACDFDYVWNMIPENRALEVANSRRIAREMRTPGIETDGLRISDLSYLPPVHCRTPGTYTVYDHKKRSPYGPIDVVKKLGSWSFRRLFGLCDDRIEPLPLPALVSRADGRHYKHLLAPKHDTKTRVSKKSRGKQAYQSEIKGPEVSLANTLVPRLRGGGPSTSESALSSSNEWSKHHPRDFDYDRDGVRNFEAERHLQEFQQQQQALRDELRPKQQKEPSTNEPADDDFEQDDSTDMVGQSHGFPEIQIHEDNPSYRSPYHGEESEDENRPPRDPLSGIHNSRSPTPHEPSREPYIVAGTDRQPLETIHEQSPAPSDLVEDRAHHYTCHRCPIFEGEYHHWCQTLNGNGAYGECPDALQKQARNTSELRHESPDDAARDIQVSHQTSERPLLPAETRQPQEHDGQAPMSNDGTGRQDEAIIIDLDDDFDDHVLYRKGPPREWDPDYELPDYPGKPSTEQDVEKRKQRTLDSIKAFEGRARRLQDVLNRADTSLDAEMQKSFEQQLEHFTDWASSTHADADATRTLRNPVPWFKLLQMKGLSPQWLSETEKELYGPPNDGNPKTGFLEKFNAMDEALGIDTSQAPADDGAQSATQGTPPADAQGGQDGPSQPFQTPSDQADSETDRPIKTEVPTEPRSPGPVIVIQDDDDELEWNKQYEEDVKAHQARLLAEEKAKKQQQKKARQPATVRQSSRIREKKQKAADKPAEAADNAGKQKGAKKPGRKAKNQDPLFKNDKREENSDNDDVAGSGTVSIYKTRTSTKSKQTAGKPTRKGRGKKRAAPEVEDEDEVDVSDEPSPLKKAKKEAT